jgi:hypothetical protein
MASEYPDIGFSKLYRKPIFFILLGIVVFALVWKIQNKWITIPIGVIAAITVLFNLQVIQTLLTVQAKYKVLKDEDENVLAIREEPSSPLHQKIVYYLFLGMFIPLSYGLTYTGKLVENFLYWKPFIQGVLIYGSIAGFVLSLFYHKKLKVVFEDKEKQSTVTLMSFLIPMLIVFHCVTWYNHLQPSAVIAVQKVIVNRKSINYNKGNKWLFLNVNNKETRFEVPERLFKQIKEGDTLTIQVKKGALDYPYVSGFDRAALK